MLKGGLCVGGGSLQSEKSWHLMEIVVYRESIEQVTGTTHEE